MVCIVMFVGHEVALLCNLLAFGGSDSHENVDKIWAEQLEWPNS